MRETLKTCPFCGSEDVLFHEMNRTYQEAHRNGEAMAWTNEAGKPEGIAVEMADCIIRILDWAGHEGMDMETLVWRKHEYNKTRPYRHGGKNL